jgi:hypothetical protein
LQRGPGIAQRSQMKDGGNGKQPTILDRERNAMKSLHNSPPVSG